MLRSEATLKVETWNRIWEIDEKPGQGGGCVEKYVCWEWEEWVSKGVAREGP